VTRLDLLRANTPKRTFTVNARLLALPTNDNAIEKLNTRLDNLCSVFDTLDGPYYEIEGERFRTRGILPRTKERIVQSEFERFRTRSVATRWRDSVTRPTNRPDSRPDLVLNADELANLVVEEHGWGVYLAVERGENAVAIDTYVGKREHLHSTAAGKAILAHLPTERVEAIVERRGLPGHTTDTLTSREALFERLDTIRERRFAFDREENLPGLRCVAAPITSDDGTVLGGISVSGPTSRLEGDRLEHELSDQITRISNIIEINVTYA
jgi:hypothetical protein